MPAASTNTTINILTKKTIIGPFHHTEVYFTGLSEVKSSNRRGVQAEFQQEEVIVTTEQTSMVGHAWSGWCLLERHGAARPDCGINHGDVQA